MAVLALVAAGSPVFAGDLKVIANLSVKSGEISSEELRSVFLGISTSLKSSGPVQPVLARDRANLNEFAISYLGKTGAALETYYRSLLFTGKWSMPVGFATDQQVVDYVARTPGAIGFVKELPPSDRVKTLRVKRD
jgi:ABC-type phosphate transport system substrate-binding protein